MLGAYRLVMGALEPLAPAILRRRARVGKEDPARLDERLGRPALPRPAGPLAWLHGASVGESLSLLPLIEALRLQRPDLTLLVTSGTVTSAELLGRRLPRGAIHQYIPLDTPGAARRFVGHWRPDLTVFVESELWPNLLLEAKARGSRLALLGARLSTGAARGWARAPDAAKAVLGAFDLILAQDQSSAGRIAALGGAVAGELDLKQAGGALPCDEDELARLRAAVGKRPVLLAASTHPGEDEVIAAAHAALPGRASLLVIAPRHPPRGAAVATMLRVRGMLAAAQRSLGEPLTPETPAYVVDTLGEMGLFYRLADVVIMGGSLTEGIGGHNPLEPARLSRPIVTGPDVANHREAFAGLVGAHAALLAEDQQALVAMTADLLNHPERAREIGLRAKAFAERGDSILDQALAALRPLLPGAAP